MNIKNFLKKYRIHLIYGINMIPSYLLYSTFTDIVFDIKHEYSYRNQLIAVELIFLLLSFILIFSLYKYYKRKYKKILIGLIIRYIKLSWEMTPALNFEWDKTFLALNFRWG